MSDTTGTDGLVPVQGVNADSTVGLSATQIPVVYPEFADLQLISYNDPRIYTEPPAFDFAVEGDKAQALVSAMLKKMYETKGLGLSANQLGLPYRVFVMGNEETQLALFNPSIVAVSKNTDLFREGCLTFPGLYLTIRRPVSCVIAYQNVTGDKVVQEFPSLSARIALHEMDHMMGKNFTDHASKFKVDWELNKLKKTALKTLRRRAQDAATKVR